MPIIKSAKKRVRVSTRATQRNRITKTSIRSAFKKLVGKASSSDYVEAQSAIDMAVKKGILHKNKAARKKAQLAKSMKAAGVKPAASVKAKSAAKPAAKAPVKKAPVKKAPAKKAPAKTKAKK